MREGELRVFLLRHLLHLPFLHQGTLILYQGLGSGSKKKNTVSSVHIFLANPFMDKDDSHWCDSVFLHLFISLPLYLWDPSSVPGPHYTYDYEYVSSS